ncbi:MAG: oxidoreductase [Chloroflexota bacterium]
MTEHFRALVVDKDGDGVAVRCGEMQRSDLMPGEVTIRVSHSSINFKDGLAARVDGRVARRYPLVLGIDLAGVVESSDDPSFTPGQAVLAHGYDIGVAHHGGLAELARLPARWVVPMPAGLTARQAMIVGTAGFTAALSVERLEHLGLRPGTGPVVVTGASGGVGSTAVAILAARGYEVVASTGSTHAHEMLRTLGAAEIVDRSTLNQPSKRPLESARWAGAVDPVGGDTLAYLLQTMKPFGSAAVSGLTGGHTLNTTVMPFILRGVNVLGINSADLDMGHRVQIWNRVATDLRPAKLEESIAREISLDEAPAALEQIYRGELVGRTVVRIS